MDEKQEKKFHQMTETPVGPLILRLAFPCIISMLISAFYNMADTFFVGMLESNAATGAVGVVFSMMAIIQAVGFFFGQGSGNFVSRELGKQNYDSASKMISFGFFTSLGVGALICLLGQVFIDPLTYFLGATDTIFPYAKLYLQIILLGSPWMTASLVLNNQLRFQGNATYAMVGVTSGSILNIILDPVLMFGFDLGIAGAAWATIIGQFFSFCLLLIGCNRGDNIRIQISQFRFSLHYFLMVVKGGLPSLSRQCLASLATICLNHAAQPFGDAAIAAMGVVQRIVMFGGSAMIGFGQGFQPVCGFSYGAKLYDRVREGFYFCVKVTGVFLVIVCLLGFIFAEPLIALFRDDPDVIACGSVALRFQCCTFFFQSWVVMTTMMQQVIGRTVPATFLSVARQGLFFIPLVLILSNTLGLLGIQMSQSIADALTLAFAIPIQLRVMRQMGQVE